MATKTAKQPAALEPEVLDAQHESQLTTTAGDDIQTFVAGVRRFFTQAAALERRAHGVLAEAKALTAPTTADEDLAVQQIIVKAKEETRVVEAHWTIAQKVHQFHKRLVAGRSRATDVLDQAVELANGHHQRYVQAERRRAAEEQERLRREAEAQAQRDREAELKRLEEQALKAEAEAPTLSAREQRFVECLLVWGENYKGREAAAASQAGYKNPADAAQRLVLLPKIVAAFSAARQAAAVRQQAAAVKAAPVEVAHVEQVKPNIAHVAGKSDRSYHSAEVVDAAAFVQAALAGQLGIPADCLMPNPVKLNEYAKSLKERLNLWPGVRYVKKDSLV